MDFINSGTLKQTEAFIDLLSKTNEGDEISIESKNGSYTFSLIKKEDLSWFHKVLFFFNGNENRLEKVILESFNDVNTLISLGNIFKERVSGDSLFTDKCKQALIKGKNIGTVLLKSNPNKTTMLNWMDNTISSLENLVKEKSAIKIQKCFREFALKKRENALEQRKNAVKFRKDLNPDEKLLVENNLDPKHHSYEIIDNRIEKLKGWNTENNLLTKREILVRQNKIINDFLLSSLETLRSSAEKAKKMVFKVVNDDEDNIQAAALFKVDETRKTPENKDIKIPLYIAYISTAPWNLKIEANKMDQRRVEGAGTALIEGAIYASIEKGYRGAVSLESVPTAIGFYEKLGFKKAEWIPSESGLLSMELSVKDAAEFLKSDRAGRALII
ncbi:MAG: GNAT family N-acetyltransferase [Parachlamydiaceae bacterium]